MKQGRNIIISSYPPIVIQSICTSWTKASRGGVNASARNRTPEIFKLPAQAISSSSKNTYLLQELFYEERNNFQQPEEKLKKIETTDPLIYDCFRLSLHENTLRVIFEWEHSTEAPSRLDFPGTEISLQDHQWIRVIYNSRSSVGGWAYKKRVFNIGFLSPASLKEAPTHTYTDMAYLW